MPTCAPVCGAADRPMPPDSPGRRRQGGPLRSISRLLYAAVKESCDMSSEHPAAENAPQPLDEWFLDLLACPACSQHWPVTLNATRDALNCKCGRYAYPIRDGIPILLVEEATLLDENAHPEDLR